MYIVTSRNRKVFPGCIDDIRIHLIFPGLQRVYLLLAFGGASLQHLRIAVKGLAIRPQGKCLTNKGDRIGITIGF